MKHVSLFAVGLMVTVSLLPISAFAASDAEVAELRAQLKILSERLAKLESQQVAERNAHKAHKASSGRHPHHHRAAAPAASVAKAPAVAAPQVVSSSAPTVAGEGEPVVGGKLPGSFKLPGTNTSIKFGGYAKLDAIYDTNGYGNQYASFASIPLDNSALDEQSGKFNMHARQSRLNMETHTPTSLGDLKTFFEVDFYGSARGNPNTTNGEGLQLRQAYGQLGKILAGQTWSNFMDMDAYPESLDYIGPAGMTFVRQAQLRYSDSLNSKTTWSVAVESPHSDFASDIVPETDLTASDMPDFTAKLQYKDTFGHVALRGMARKLDASDPTGIEEDSAFGWGVGLSGKLLTYKKDSLVFQGVYGTGIGHYLFDVAVSQNGNTYVGNNFDPRPAWGGYAGYQHYWSDTLRSNILGGYTGIDNSDPAFYIAAPNKEVMSGHINLIWNPAPSYRVGIEYMHGFRELEDGTEGNLDRFQSSFMYLF